MMWNSPEIFYLQIQELQLENLRAYLELYVHPVPPRPTYYDWTQQRTVKTNTPIEILWGWSADVVGDEHIKLAAKY